MAVIKVPKTPKKAFNTHRRPSALLLGQIAHLEWAVLPAAQRQEHQLPTQTVTTEGQAAERVAQLSMLVLAASAPAAAGEVVLGPVTLPPLPPGPTNPPAQRRHARSTKKAARKARRRRTNR